MNDPDRFRNLDIVRFITLGMSGGVYQYGLTADQDIEERTCPQCFRPFSDYEDTAVFPCWQCRYEVPLASFGSLETAWDQTPPMDVRPFDVLTDIDPERRMDIEHHFDEEKEGWLMAMVADREAALAREREVWESQGLNLPKSLIRWHKADIDSIKQNLEFHRSDGDPSVAYRRAMKDRT